MAEKKIESKKPNLKYQHDRDREIVTGKFVNRETPGGEIQFCFRKYREDKVEKYTMQDGKIYKVPRGVALHVANGCWYPVHSFKQDDFGKASQEIGTKTKRFDFIPLDFIIDDEFEINRTNNIVTVRDLNV